MTRLEKMRAEKIWPNGKRHLFSDAIGLVLLVSLYKEVPVGAFLRAAFACILQKHT